MSLRAAVTGTASYLPADTLTNDRLATELGNWSATEIAEKTGISSRHIAGPDECASDLGVKAAERLFESGTTKPEDIDYLIFCTQSPDYFLPTTACLLQARLGLRTDVGALDVNQGCSGYVYSLSLAKGLIESGVVRRVLVITAETYSKFINARDRSVRTIFGDAAAASLVEAVESHDDLLGPFVFGTDGRGAKNLIVKTGGMRRPRSDQSAVETEDKGSWRSDDNLYMNGPEIFNFTLRAVPAAVSELLARSGETVEGIDHFIFHQANRFMLDRLRSKIGIPEAKFSIELENCGNTVSSTIPITIERGLQRGIIAKGHRAMLVGFGVGYSWAAALMRIV